VTGVASITVREIILDTETTGLDPASGDRMVEIGMVEMIGRVETGRTFHAYFNPQRSMPAEAEAVHGLSEHFLSDKPCFSELAQELVDFIDGAILVAHNAQFDIGFIDAELSRCGHLPYGMTNVVDTLALARTRHPGSKHSLDALCTRYGVDRSHRIKHGALLDAQLLAQVYIELTGGRQIGLELHAETPRPNAVGGVGIAAAIQIERRYLPPRPHAPSAAEIERHQAFVARIADALWLRQE